MTIIKYFKINKQMPRFKSKCPFCSDNSWINWYHSGCSSNKGENIDVQLGSCKISKDMFDVRGNRSIG